MLVSVVVLILSSSVSSSSSSFIASCYAAVVDASNACIALGSNVLVIEISQLPVPGHEFTRFSCWSILSVSSPVWVMSGTTRCRSIVHVAVLSPLVVSSQSFVACPSWLMVITFELAVFDCEIAPISLL